MSKNKILVAFDLNEPAQRLKDTVSQYLQAGDEVHICTVILPLEMMYAFVPVGGYSMAVGGIQEELLNNAQKRLNDISEELKLDKKYAHLLIGKASIEIKSFAKEHDVNLIVVGTHAKGALRAALGSTSSGVLHGAPCDVLALVL